MILVRRRVANEQNKSRLTAERIRCHDSMGESITRIEGILLSDGEDMKEVECMHSCMGSAHSWSFIQFSIR